MVKGVEKKEFRWGVLVASLLIVAAVAFIGGMFTDTGSWYDSIKPSITPPNFVFPIAWSIIFFLISLSLYFAWTGSKDGEKVNVGILFGINLFFNIFWSFLFFYIKNVKLAFLEILILWISIAILFLYCLKVDRKASWLLLPYLAWVSFATFLNYLMAFH
ncbi:MAG: TspO/MBR family protein [Candidatus Pacearchaeota archaeon]